jgi:hypothetical protein
MRLLAIEQKDGTYFVRPFGNLPFVYHADKLVTGRLIKFYRKFNAWAFWGALISGALSLPFLLNFSSDHMLLATVIFMVGASAMASAGAIGGAFFILRHALRVPEASFPAPKSKAEPVRWRLLRVAATIAIMLSLVDLFYPPQEIPFWNWIVTALVAFALIVFVADHVRRQHQQSGAPPAPKINDRAVQRRRTLWATLLGPLANPLALWMLVAFPFAEPDAFEVSERFFGLIGLLFAASYVLGLALGLLLLLGWGRWSLWWYLSAATLATLVMTPVCLSLLSPYFSDQVGIEMVLWLSTMAPVFIAFPTVIAFWLIARPDRWALDADSGNVAGQAI